MSTSSRPERVLLLLAALLSALWCTALSATETTTLAIYQFRPESMDAMGFESDVMLAIRNEMENYPDIDLLAKRYMEDVLSRRDIAQEYSLESAVQGGRHLSVRYVLVGSVSKRGAKITADLMLVDVNLGEAVKSWRSSYRTRNEIDSTASELVASIVAAAQQRRQPAALQAEGGKRGETGVLEGLTATPRASDIEIVWRDTPGDDVLGYNVYRAESPDGPYSFLGSSDGKRYLDGTAQQGVKYYYQVSEFNFDGTETRSSRVAQAQLQSALASSRVSPPLIYTLKPLVGGVDLDFVAALDEGSAQPASFRVYRAEDSGGWDLIGEVAASTRRSSSRSTVRYKYMDTRLASGVDAFRYAVSAVLPDGEESEKSDAFEYTPPRLSVPEVEQQNLLREGRLRWQPARLGNGYRIYRREGDSGWVKVGEVNGLLKTAYRDTEGLMDGREYEYSYTVFDDLSESPRSRPVTVATKPPPPPPAGLDVSRGLARRVTLEWDSVKDPDVQHYVVYRANYSDSASVEMSPVAVLDTGSGARWTDTGEAAPLTDGGRYVYAVASRNRFGGEGPLSQTVEATTKAPPPPVTAATTAIDGNAIRVSWRAGGDDVAAYVLFRRWAGSDWVELARVPPGRLEYRDEELPPYAALEYRVVVVDTTELRSAAAETAAVTSPVEVQLAAGDTPLLRRTELSWNPQTLVQGYEVQRKGPDDGNWQRVATLDDGTATRHVDDKNLMDGQSYQYRVVPTAAGKALGESNIVQSETKVVTAPDGLTASEGMARQITLTWPAARDKDIAGYVVYRARGADNAAALKPYAELEGASNTRFIDRGTSDEPLEHGVPYRYAIAAKHVMGGVGPPGPPVQGSSKPLPEPVYNLVAFADEGAITLRWDYDDKDNVGRYLLSSRESGGSWQPLTELKAGQTSHRDEKLKPYVTLQYRLQVRDVDELLSNAALSPEVTSPARVQIETTSERRLREVALSWNSQFGIDGFLLQRRAAGQSDWVDIRTLRDGDATACVDKKDLEDGVEYEYRLYALDDGRKLGHSNTVTAVTKELPPPPAQLQASSGLHGRVELTWSPLDDPDIGGYTIYRVDNGELTRLDSVSGHDSASYRDDGGVFNSLEVGADYSYAVAAFNRYRAEGRLTDLVTGSTKPAPVPVTGLVASEDDGTVNLNWNASPEPDITHYLIERSSDPDCDGFRRLARVSARDRGFRDDKARPQSRYCYKLVAVDEDALESAPSQIVEVVTSAVVSVE